MLRTRYAPIQIFRNVAHKAECHILSKALFGIGEGMVQILLMLEVLFTQVTKIAGLGPGLQSFLKAKG